MASINIDKYITHISQLNPLKDSKFVYEVSRWSKLLPRYKKLIFDFENKSIARKDVIKAYSDYYNNKGDAMRAFMLTMIWGFSNTGYGTHRTNTYIKEPKNVAHIIKAIDAVKQNDLESAFSELKKIKGLGVSYSTKVLYFASRGAKQKTYALIYDIRVASALVQLTAPKEIFDIVSINPSTKFVDYCKYIALIHNLAEMHKIEAESIELFLFNQKF